jgi:ABC-2 type transport system ATP-binding protein
MGEDRYRKIAEYSTGMKQKVKMAQALVHDPDIVFFDEPTNGLDPEGRREMLDLLCDVSQAGKSIVLSTHLLPDVEHVCSDVVIMGGGRVHLYDRLRLHWAPATRVCIRGDALSFRQPSRARPWQRRSHGDIFVVGGDVSAQGLNRYRTASSSDISPQTMSLKTYSSAWWVMRWVGRPTLRAVTGERTRIGTRLRFVVSCFIGR